MRHVSLCLLGTAVAMVGLAPIAQAATITQDPTKNYVAFEAESNVTLVAGSSQFGVVSDATASGGGALFASGTRNDATKGIATYTIKFVNAGTYILYDRVRTDESLLPGLNGNSSFVPSAFDVAPTLTSSSNGVAASGTYFSLFEHNGDYVTYRTYTVTAEQVVSFTIGTREMGLYVDRFAFVDSTAPLPFGFPNTPADGMAAFDALANSPVPEPTSLASLLVTGLLLARRARRA